MKRPRIAAKHSKRSPSSNRGKRRQRPRFGAYKPANANFDYLLTGLGELGYSPSTDIVHVAQSLFHDHGPAERFGIDRVWIDRQRLSEGGDWGATARLDHIPSVDFTYFTMAEFADAVDASFRDDS